jgi:Zn-dependent protease/CBS domain-containing protein
MADSLQVDNMRGFRVGSVAGFEISIDWSWLIILFLVIYSLGAFVFPTSHPGLSTAVNWTISVIAAFLLFVSVLVHELMHSVVARRFGIDIKGITLFIFGGVSQTKEEPESPKVEFWMAIAGPLTSFAIGIVFYLLTLVGQSAIWPVAVLAITSYIGWINVVLAIFNMVPGFPLDGGRVLRSAIWSATRSLERSTRYASYIGQGFGYMLMGFGFFNIVAGGAIGGIWLIFIGWFLAGAARQSYEQVVLKEALSGVEVERVMTEDVPTVPSTTAIDDFVRDFLMRYQYSTYPVVDDAEVRGTVGIEQVQEIPRERWASMSVADITQPVDEEGSVSKDDDAWDALMKLSTEDKRRLLVMHDHQLDGTVSQESILRIVRTRMQLGV